MIKVQDIKVDANGIATVSLFADTKGEVPDDMTGVEVVGFPKGVTIGFGSDVMTAKGEIAFRKSDETWEWV